MNDEWKMTKVQCLMFSDQSSMTNEKDVPLFPLRSSLVRLPSALPSLRYAKRLSVGDRAACFDGRSSSTVGGPKELSAWAAKCAPTCLQDAARFHDRSCVGDRFGTGATKLANIAVAAGKRHRERPVARWIATVRPDRSSGFAGGVVEHRAELHLADIPCPETSQKSIP